MSITKYTAVVLSLVSTMAMAEPSRRQETIAELVRATGLAEMLDQSRDAARAQAAGLSDQMFSQLVGESSVLSAEKSSELMKVAIDEYAAELRRIMAMSRAQASGT